MAKGQAVRRCQSFRWGMQCELPAGHAEIYHRRENPKNHKQYFSWADVTEDPEQIKEVCR